MRVQIDITRRKIRISDPSNTLPSIHPPPCPPPSPRPLKRIETFVFKMQCIRMVI